jgi:GntR family transcriptional regulator, rspAB operon transcriptional repressor
VSSLRTQIASQIRTEIIERRLPAGKILLEKSIAARFEVSKTPVREALALLCEEGLVQLFPRRGYIVRGLTVQDVADTFDLRLILEGAAAERAAPRLTSQELVTLRSLAAHDCCGEIDPAVSHRLETMRHSLDFHVLIARASGNELLADQIDKLLRASRRITSIGFVYGDHVEICAALEARDGARARAAMEKHILSGREEAMRALAGRAQGMTVSDR